MTASATANAITIATAAMRHTLAAPNSQMTKPTGIATTATSVITTPIPIVKLSARNLTGHDIALIIPEIAAEWEERFHFHRTVDAGLTGQSHPSANRKMVSKGEALEGGHWSQILRSGDYLDSARRA